MYGTIIDFEQYVVLIQYEKKGSIERCYLPRTFVDTSKKGTRIRFTEKNSLPYPVVELTLGDLDKTTIQAVEQRFRRTGLWTAEDYRRNYRVVAKVAKEFGLDPTLILNAAAAKVVENNEY